MVELRFGERIHVALLSLKNALLCYSISIFGLSSERSSSSAKSNWTIAVLVADFSLPLVGHYEIYFMNENGEWIFTEYNTTPDASGLKDIKDNAQVWYDVNPDVSQFYDNETHTFIENPKEINYAVLTGDFNESVAIAQSYYHNQSMGRYNLLFNNCADYTNILLYAADLDGMYNQMFSEGHSLISIPALKEFKLSASSKIDSTTNNICDGLNRAGTSIKGYNFFGDVVGDMLIGTDEVISTTTDFLGDAIDTGASFWGKAIDGGKYLAATTTNFLIDAGSAAIDYVDSFIDWLF